MTDLNSSGIAADAFAVALGRELADLRHQLNLTQRQAVARYHERTGRHLADRSLLSYERAHRVPSLARLVELADVYGVSPVWLFSEAIRKAGRDPSCLFCGRDSDG